MRILDMLSRGRASGDKAALAGFLDGFSIEVMPRTLARVTDLPALLPRGTTVYIAHINGTPIDEMVAAARALRAAGYLPMPHIPARLVATRAELADWLARYRGEAGVDSALLLAGGVAAPAGDFHSSMQLVETGLFDRAGFRRLFFAGHPEGNRDIDTDGGTALADAALSWKQAFARRTEAEVALVTQFVFEAAPVIAWSQRIAAAGVDLPIHVGLAGPAKLQTLIRYAIACGVGPSLKVLQKRAADVTRLLLPHTPDAVAAALADHVARTPESHIAGAHLFPLGGIQTAADWAAEIQSGRKA